MSYTGIITLTEAEQAVFSGSADEGPTPFGNACEYLSVYWRQGADQESYAFHIRGEKLHTRFARQARSNEVDWRCTLQAARAWRVRRAGPLQRPEGQVNCRRVPSQSGCSCMRLYFTFIEQFKQGRVCIPS